MFSSQFSHLNKGSRWCFRGRKMTCFWCCDVISWCTRTLRSLTFLVSLLFFFKHLLRLSLRKQHHTILLICGSSTEQSPPFHPLTAFVNVGVRKWHACSSEQENCQKLFRLCLWRSVDDGFSCCLKTLNWNSISKIWSYNMNEYVFLGFPFPANRLACKCIDAILISSWFMS